MKNNVLLIILVILVFIFGLCAGYILGIKEGRRSNVSSNINSNLNLQNENNQITSAVGSYKNDSWNGKSAALVLKSDGTCLYPTGGTGTWTQNGNIIEIILNHDTGVHTAEIVPGGVILHEKFFELVS